MKSDLERTAHKSLRKKIWPLRLRAELLYATLNKSIPAAHPDFLCIGAPRTGTTWLYQTLSQHPDIYLPRRKELHYFDEPIIENRHGNLQDINSCPNGMYFDMHNPAHWRWYQLQFVRSGGRVTGDITPAYSRISEAQIKMLTDRMSNIKVIYMMRDPVERAWSGVRKFAMETLGLKISDAPINEIVDFTMYPRRLMSGDYRSVINKWESNIESSRILYLFYDDLLKNPQQLANTVCKFLELDPFQQSDSEQMSKRVNKAEQIDEMPASIRDMLRDYYKGQVEYLEQKFDRDLSEWKY